MEVKHKVLNLNVPKSTFDDANLTIRGIIASTGRLDRHGERINPEGWHFENYNGKVLINHTGFVNRAGDKDPVMMNYIKGENPRVEKGIVLIDFVFNPQYENAIKLYNDVKNGFAPSVSVGFMVVKFGVDGSEFDFDEVELLEVSLVDIPANPDAGVSKKKDIEGEEAQKETEESTEGDEKVAEVPLENTDEAQPEIEKPQAQEGQQSPEPKTFILTEAQLKAIVSEAIKTAREEEKVIVPDNMEAKQELINLAHKMKHVHTQSGRALKALSNYFAIKTAKFGNSGEGGDNN